MFCPTIKKYRISRVQDYGLIPKLIFDPARNQILVFKRLSLNKVPFSPWLYFQQYNINGTRIALFGKNPKIFIP